MIKFRLVLFTLCFSMIANCLYSQAIGTVTDNSVRFRKSPVLTSDIISQFNRGDKVVIIENDKKIDIKNQKIYCWLKVEFNGTIGYVYSEFIESNYMYKIDPSNFMRDNPSRIGAYSRNISQYQITLNIIDSNIKLYNYDLIEMQSINNTNTLQYVTDLYDDFYNFPFVVLNNTIKKMCPVNFNSNQYLVLEDQITPFYKGLFGNLYYLKYDIIIYETNYKDMPFLIIPIHVIYEKNKVYFREIWRSKSLVRDGSAIYHEIKSISYGNGLFLINETTKIDVFQSHGAYSDVVNAYKLNNGKLDLISQLIIYGD